MLFLHGDKDEVIPPRASQQTVKAIEKEATGAQVELKLLPGRGHDVVLGRDGAQVLAFFSRQARDAFPRRVVLKTRDPAVARSFWIEILAKKPGWAEAEAWIDEAGTIEIKSQGVERMRLLLRRELVRPGPVRVTVNGRATDSVDFVEDCGLLLRTWRETGDPFLAHAAEIVIEPRRQRGPHFTGGWRSPSLLVATRSTDGTRIARRSSRESRGSGD